MKVRGEGLGIAPKPQVERYDGYSYGYETDFTVRVGVVRFSCRNHRWSGMTVTLTATKPTLRFGWVWLGLAVETTGGAV
jgi:hypothetical protein